jgi:hypothetical protein
LAKKRKARTSSIGLIVGHLFSLTRDGFADFVLTSEKSYRGTLLGIHHGYDLISLFGRAAREEGDEELASWCDAWVKERGELIAAANDALQWFAQNPGIAMSNAKTRS